MRGLKLGDTLIVHKMNQKNPNPMFQEYQVTEINKVNIHAVPKNGKGYAVHFNKKNMIHTSGFEQFKAHTSIEDFYKWMYEKNRTINLRKALSKEIMKCDLEILEKICSLIEFDDHKIWGDEE